MLRDILRYTTWDYAIARRRLTPRLEQLPQSFTPTFDTSTHFWFKHICQTQQQQLLQLTAVSVDVGIILYFNSNQIRAPAARSGAKSESAVC